MSNTTCKVIYVSHLIFTGNYELGMSIIPILQMKKSKLRD